MIETIFGGLVLVCGWLFWAKIRSMEKRIDFLTLCVVAEAGSTGDDEKDFQSLIDRMDAAFGKEKEIENEG